MNEQLNNVGQKTTGSLLINTVQSLINKEVAVAFVSDLLDDADLQSITITRVAPGKLVVDVAYVDSFVGPATNSPNTSTTAQKR